MGGIVNSITNLGRRSDIGIGGFLKKIDPVASAIMKADVGTQNAVLGKPGNNRKYYGEGPIAPPTAPTQDTAANASLQQQDMLRRRRGVFANIFAGGAAPAPSTATKSTLGS